MQELITSIMRFTTAVTLFGMQQVQNAVGIAADTTGAINRFRAELDKLSDAVEQHIDDSKKATLDSMLRAQVDLVDRGFTAMNMQVLDPREMVQTTTDLMRKTTDSLVDMMKKTADGAQTSGGSAEPQKASEALAGGK
ncbi:MAG: hypothetical protein WD696_19445 [Bryobacteraceae bacterium]